MSDEPRTVLEHLIRAGDMGYAEIAAQIGISERHLRRLARGERANTQPPTRRALQAHFHRPLDELLASWSPGQIFPSITRPPQGHDMEVVDMAASRARDFFRAAQTGLTDDGLEQVHDDVRHIARVYPQRPLTEVLGHLADTQDSIFGLIEGHQRPNQLRQLYFLAGITSGLLAKASHDVADPHAALAQARTAYLCADHADHNGLRAWIRGLQSLVSYWAGSAREAIRYAQAGQAVNPGSTTSVWLHVSEARAWAALGNADRALDSIRAADEAWAAVRPDDELDELGGICTFGRSRQLYYAADALAWLPNEAQTGEQYSTEAVEAYSDQTHPDWAFGDAAGSRCDLAIARIHSGKLDGAAEVLRPVLDLPVDRRINGIIHSVQRVHRSLSVAGLGHDAAAQDLQEEIELFARMPVRVITK